MPTKKQTSQEINLDSLIKTIEGLLHKEITNLPNTLLLVSADKRVDFISKTLPVVIKYRETHPQDGDWSLPDWGK